MVTEQFGEGRISERLYDGRERLQIRGQAGHGRARCGWYPAELQLGSRRSRCSAVAEFRIGSMSGYLAR
jgi:hypothetical protein